MPDKRWQSFLIWHPERAQRAEGDLRLFFKLIPIPCSLFPVPYSLSSSPPRMSQPLLPHPPIQMRFGYLDQ
jgi:hypothetical protein